MREIENQTFTGLHFAGDTFRDLHFLDCVFENCTMDGCQLEHCIFTECRFVNCRLRDNKSRFSEMRSGVFQGCALVNVDWFKWTPSSKITQSFDKLENCDLRYNYFQDTNLTRFDFRSNRIVESMFSDCNLQKALFRECDLNKTEFTRCDLRSADFREATGYRIGIRTNTLKGAHFSTPDVLALLADLEIHLD